MSYWNGGADDESAVAGGGAGVGVDVGGWKSYRKGKTNEGDQVAKLGWLRRRAALGLGRLAPELELAEQQQRRWLLVLSSSFSTVYEGL